MVALWFLLLAVAAGSAAGGLVLEQAGSSARTVGAGVDESDGADAPIADGTIESGELRAQLVWFGVGNVARAGDWTALRIETTDLGSEAREILIQAEIDDPDGDTQRATRVVTSNPGQTLGTWIYFRLPFSFGSSDRLTVVVSEARSTADGSGYTRGRILSRFQSGVPGGRTSPRELPVSLVIGPSDLGLRGLGPEPQSTRADWGHEPTLVEMLSHRDLPDRWQGLSVFDTIVWGPATGDDYSPLTLDTARADAIRAWVRRGGHLVVVLPQSGQLWSQGSRNPLLDVLPAVSITRREGVDLNRLRTLFTDSSTLALPTEAVVHTFTVAPDTPRPDAMPLIDGSLRADLASQTELVEKRDADNADESEGAELAADPELTTDQELTADQDPTVDPIGTVAVRRLYGAGTVTLVGLPLGDRRLATLGLPQAAQIWHPLLGGAGDTHPDPNAAGRNFVGGTVTTPLDEGVATEISDTGSAAVGVLLGMLLFGTYWVLAGPLIYFGLGKKRRQHAWVGFFAVTLVFTGIAWAGAQIIRPKQTASTHLSVLTGVHGAEWVQARTFASILIPSYGDAEIRVGQEPDGGVRARDSQLLAVWDAPEASGLLGAGFPDARSYDMPATMPRAFEVPVRQTVKQFVADWAGPERASWQLPRPVREVGDRFEPELRQLEGGRAEGLLQHGLPGAINDLEILVIEGTSLGPVMTDLARARGRAYRLRGTWEPETVLSLEQVTAPGPDGRPSGSLLMGPTGYLDDVANDAQPRSLTGFGGFGGGGPVSDGRVMQRLRALPFLRVLPEETLSQGQTRVQYSRRMLHGLDLSLWFTQPCIIIVGRLELDELSDAGTPAPLFVNGEPVAARGTTLVWWVYPLEPVPASADVYITDPALP